MNYQVEHRKHILNQYLITKGNDTIKVDKTFTKLHDFINHNLPRKKFKITSNTHNHLLFYSNHDKEILAHYHIESETLILHSLLWSIMKTIIRNGKDYVIYSEAEKILKVALNKHYNNIKKIDHIDTIDYWEGFKFEEVI